MSRVVNARAYYDALVSRVNELTDNFGHSVIWSRNPEHTPLRYLVFKTMIDNGITHDSVAMVAQTSESSVREFMGKFEYEENKELQTISKELKKVKTL